MGKKKFVTVDIQTMGMRDVNFIFKIGNHLYTPEWSNMTNIAFWRIHLLVAKRMDSCIHSKLFIGSLALC